MSGDHTGDREASDGREPGFEKLYVQTPLIESRTMSDLSDMTIYLKLENTQPTASFKLRGISNLIQEEIARGSTRLVASSGGNAGLAAAYTARKLGVPIRIYVPESTPQYMVDRIRAEKAEVVVHGTVWDESNAEAVREAQSPGCAIIHPFDHPDIWTGTSSLVDEIAERLPAIPDLIVVAVGGGGLLCGVVQGLDRVGWNDVPVLAMETDGANCLNAAVSAGKIVSLPTITSVATSLGALQISAKAFEYATERGGVVSGVVSDRQAVDACIQFADDHHMLVEPACGAALAAVYSKVIERLQGEDRLNPSLKTVVVIVCGGSAVNCNELRRLQTELS